MPIERLCVTATASTTVTADSARGLRQQESCTVPRQVKRFHSVHVTLAWVMAEKGIGLSPTARVIGNPKRLRPAGYDERGRTHRETVVDSRTMLGCRQTRQPKQHRQDEHSAPT